MIRYYNEIWLEKKQEALFDALTDIENILNYGSYEVPYFEDFEKQIKFIKENMQYLDELDKDIEKFLEEEDFKTQEQDVNLILDEIYEILWIDENNIPYDTMFGYKMGFITRKQKEIKRVSRNLEGTLDDYDRDEPWDVNMD